MIAKKIPMRKKKLSSFEGLVNYIASSQGVNNRIGKVEMHNYGSADLQWAIQETLAVQDQNKRSEADKTYHLMVSFATGEYVDDEQLSRIEQSMIEALGFAEHQRVSVVHRDTDNLHFHVAINKIHPEKKTVYEPYNDFKILGKECRKFEDELGLKKVERGRKRNQSIDMEEVAGIESLIGWVRRECSKGITQSQSWDDVHSLLAQHGLKIKLRGNGLVISNGEIHVKASSVDREFSKKNLEARLGEFQQAEAKNFSQPKREYQEKPISTVNVDLLFKQYQEEKKEQKVLRQSYFAGWSEDRKKKIEAIKSKYAFRRSLIKHSRSSGVTKKLLYKMLYKQMQNEMKAVRSENARRRTDFFENNKSLAWADWLKKQAKNGNADALEALRRRGKKTAKNGNRFVGEESAAYADLKVDTVTKKGTIVYTEDAMAIRDSGSSLKLAAIPDDKAVSRALGIAVNRYGNVLHITGTQQFQDKVARVAAAKNLKVTFSDQNLNQRYQQYLKEYEYVRKHAHRYGDFDGSRSEYEQRQRREASRRSGGNDSRPKRYRQYRYERSGNRGFDGGLSIREYQKLAHTGGIGARREQEVAERSHRVRRMSQRSLVRNERRTQVLLSGNVPYHVEQSRTPDNSVVRRTVYRSGRVGTLEDVKKIQAIVGRVAKPGTKPPSFRRDGWSQLSNLPVLDATSRRKAVEQKIETSPVKQPEAAKDMLPIEKYIYERQDKIKKGFDIMNHRQYNSTDSGAALFQGVRNVDGQALLLFRLKDAEEIVVMNITPYTARRLSKVKLGSEIKITHQGQVRVVKGRSI